MNEPLKKQIDEQAEKAKKINPEVYRFGYGQALADCIPEFWRREDTGEVIDRKMAVEIIGKLLFNSKN